MSAGWWTFARDEQLQALWAAGTPCRAIGEALGCSFNAVTGRARRLDLPGRPSPVTGTRRADAARQARTDLAEEMANGCPTVSEAARRLCLTQSRADQHWQAIKNGLGVEQCR